MQGHDSQVDSTMCPWSVEGGSGLFQHSTNMEVSLTWTSRQDGHFFGVLSRDRPFRTEDL